MDIAGVADGLCYQDALPPRATRPRSALSAREELVVRPEPGDLIYVADLLCLGVSRKDVAWFVDELHGRGATIVIHEGAQILKPGNDMAGLLERFARARNALYIRRFRAKAKGRGSGTAPVPGRLRNA